MVGHKGIAAVLISCSAAGGAAAAAMELAVLVRPGGIGGTWHWSVDPS